MDPTPHVLPPELDYVLLLFALFVVPRILQRYGMPTAITSVALGALAGVVFGLFAGDATVQLLSTFGIVSLFLFAGLEVDFPELQRERRVLAQHVIIGMASLLLVTLAAGWVFGLGWRPALLVGLALMTPSTGFILDSLRVLRVSPEERFWIKSKAVAAELVALGVLFIALQSTSTGKLSVSLLVLIGMIVLLPLLFRLFASLVVPFAPKSEFAFLLMLAVLCAFITRRLGVYYLVGAFVVGITAQRFRARLPAIASEQMLHAVELFASFFVPFYFFNAGLHLRAGDFGVDALAAGGAFLLLAIPLRIAIVALHRRVALGESWRQGARIGVSMLPTLVFTLVIAEQLRDTYSVPRAVFGGLIIYTLLNTLVPGLALRLPTTDLESWPDTAPENRLRPEDHSVNVAHTAAPSDQRV